ncbi:MAG: cupredoxin domain-containing protein [Nanoarchaeota archaeon]
MENQEDSEETIEDQENSKAIKNDKKYFFRFVLIFAVVLISAIIFGMSNPFGANANSSAQASATGNVAAIQDNGNVQVAKMKVSGGQYLIEPSSFKKGVPVRIEADISQIPGCSKSIVISAFNIRKSLSSSDNIIEFTPDKAGTFNIACSMNMYRGTFTVLDSDGKKANYVEPASTGGSCGGSGGGGCGCGG